MPGSHERPRDRGQNACKKEKSVPEFLPQYPGFPSAHNRWQAEAGEDQADQENVVSGPHFNEFPRIGETPEDGEPHEEDDAYRLNENGISESIPIGILEVQPDGGSWLSLQDSQHEKSEDKLRNPVDQVYQPPGADIRQCAA